MEAVHGIAGCHGIYVIAVSDVEFHTIHGVQCDFRFFCVYSFKSCLCVVFTCRCHALIEWHILVVVAVLNGCEHIVAVVFPNIYHFLVAGVVGQVAPVAPRPGVGKGDVEPLHRVAHGTFLAA